MEEKKRITNEGSDNNRSQYQDLVEGVLDIQNNGCMRDVIKVALKKINGLHFRTPLEAKHGL
jgi:hypothetical protein